jgi:uncharacterized oxidoreductase
MRMSGNTMLITGGSSGIGLGLARRFHTDGNTVVVAGRREQLLTAVTAGHPGMDSVVLDVEDPDSIRDAISSVFAKHPDLNVVINNAGMMLPEDLTDPRHLDVAERTVTTNLLGPIRVLTHVVPLLTAQPRATIINVSSGLAFVPLPMTPTYCATKAAIHSYTQSLRVQLAGTGVQVMELVPPAVQTDLMGQAARGQGMALEAFLSEVMDLLRDTPDAKEICVSDVLMMRNAEAEGRHAEVLTTMSGVH